MGFGGFTHANFPIPTLRVSINAIIFVKDIYTYTIIQPYAELHLTVVLRYVNTTITRDNVFFRTVIIMIFQ